MEKVQLIDKPKAVFSWSGGKDSALALQKVLLAHDFEIIALLTTINETTNDSSIHRIPVHLLEKQAQAIGIPLHLVSLTENISNYNQTMHKVISNYKDMGVTHFIFGDIFLEDVRKYREQNLQPLHMKLVQPLWGMTSEEVLAEFYCSGIKAKIIVADAEKLGKAFIGKKLDASLIRTLPENVEICGENGEYHSFVYDAPFFEKAITFKISEIVKLSYTFKLDTGAVITSHFWQAIIG